MMFALIVQFLICYSSLALSTIVIAFGIENQGEKKYHRVWKLVAHLVWVTPVSAIISGMGLTYVIQFLS